MYIFQATIFYFMNFYFVSVNSANKREIPETSGSQNQPHIIVFIADDLGWNDVSFHGSDQIPTPNIDALAANGIILNRHYVQPICTPSRTAFLTGQYPIRTGMQGYPLSAGERWGISLGTPLLPEYLRDLGYTTRLVGKWHVGYYTVDHTPTHRGFDSFYGYYNGYIKYFDHTISQDNVTGYDLHRDTPRTSNVEYNGEYFTDVITKEVENVIKDHDVSRPLYLQIAHLAPHSGEHGEPMEVWNSTEVDEIFGYIEDTDRRKYAGMVARLDQSVGRTIQALKEARMLENSIVVFLSDNGAPSVGYLLNHGSNYPLRGQKFSLFDGGVRGAACIYSPLLNNVSRVSNELMHITDWMPTLYSAAGGNLDALGEIDGINQWPALKDGGESPRSSLLLNIDEVNKVSGAIFGQFKLLKGFNSGRDSDFYGHKGTMNSYSGYDPKSVFTSDAGQAIAETSNFVATTRQIIALRNTARIHCLPRKDYSMCDKTCLFDLSKDPCETLDISGQNPKILERLESFIERYTLLLSPQSDGKYDPRGSADNFGGVWMPWMIFNWNNMTEYLIDNNNVDRDTAQVLEQWNNNDGE